MKKFLSIVLFLSVSGIQLAHADGCGLSKSTSGVKCQTIEGTIDYTYDSMHYIKLAWLTDSKGLRHLIVDSHDCLSDPQEAMFGFLTFNHKHASGETIQIQAADTERTGFGLPSPNTDLDLNCVK